MRRNRSSQHPRNKRFELYEQKRRSLSSGTDRNKMPEEEEEEEASGKREADSR